MRSSFIFDMILVWFSLFMLCTADEFAFFDAVEAGDAKAISEALEAGLVDADYNDENGYTPLILASKSGHLDAMNTLLDGGADIELSADYPAPVDTPLTSAAQNGQLEAVELLLARGAKIDGRGRDGRTALISAAAKGCLHAVELLLERGTTDAAAVDATKLDGSTALSWAAHGGHDQVVLALLTHGAAVGARDQFDGSQPIHFACQGQGFNASSSSTSTSTSTSNGTSPSPPPPSTAGVSGGCGVSSQSTRRVINHLLTFGADAGARTGVTGPRDPNNPGSFKADPKREELSGGRTPLHVAAAEGNLEAVRLLLATGVTTKTLSEGGGGEGGGVEVDAVDVQGLSAVALAAMQGNRKTMELLLDTGGARPDTPARDARAPLHHAAFHGHPECARLLVKFGAKVDQPSALTNGEGPGQSPLLVASFQGNAKVVRFLLKAGANPNSRAKDGATPLIAGASGGHAKVVKSLLAAGADPRLRLEGGETPASLTKSREVAKALYLAEYEIRANERDEAVAAEEEEAAAAAYGESSEDEAAVIDLDAPEDDHEDLEQEEEEEDEEKEDGKANEQGFDGSEL